MKITRIAAEDVASRIDELAGLLRDAVEHGASMGFVLPLPAEEARVYWTAVMGEVAAGRKCLFVAEDDRGAWHGTVQLALEMRANGRHRAEVQKLIVRHALRGAGIGTQLMAAVEEEARAKGRALLFLDTSVGRGGAVRFYAQLGYTRCGGIPDFACDPDGTLADNAIFYKRLELGNE